MKQGTRIYRNSLLATGLLVAGGLSLLSSTPAAERAALSAPVTSTTSDAAKRALQTLGERPLGFEQNRGQFDQATKFAARGAGYGIFLTDSDAVLALRRGDTGKTAFLRMSVVDAQPASTALAGVEPLSGAISYYRGNGASRVEASTQAYARVMRANVYDGVDLVYYGNQQHLEYDFIVAPGRDPRAIRMQFSGADRVEIDAQSGDLLLHVPGGEPVRQHKPITYQMIDGTRRPVESRYVLASHQAAVRAAGVGVGVAAAVDVNATPQVQFEIGAYDATQPLVIDPTLTYSTYFGSLSEELIGDIALDPAGNIYVVGRTEDAPQFPTTPGAFQVNKPGNIDGFVSKFNPAGTALIYSTFLGGAQNDSHTEHFNRLAVDSAGNVYVVGATLSADYPMTGDAEDATFSGDVPTGNQDAFYTKLNPAGGLAYSTFIGGNKSDLATGVAVDTAGNVYISGVTNSTTAEGFIITGNGYDNTLGGGRDLFLIKYNNANVRQYSTYIGGAGSENIYEAEGGLAVDDIGNAYVVSSTWSNDFPLKNAAQATLGGSNDGTLTVIDTTKAGANSLVYSTYIGGPNQDGAYAAAFAGNGQVVVVGEARDNFPTKNAMYATFRGGTNDAFLARYDTTQTGAASLLWATFYGGAARDLIEDIAIDAAGNLHIVGHTVSDNFPTVSAIRTIRYQTDPFAAKLTGNGQTIVYSTFLGSNTNKNDLRAVAVNAIGETYLAGYNWNATTDPPNAQGFLVRNPFQATYGGGDGDGWIAKIGFDSDAQITMTATPEPVLPNYNVTYTISVRNNSTDPAANVVVTDTLPAQVTFVSCVSDGGGVCGGTGNVRTVTFPTVGGNGLATITIVAKVAAGLGPAVAFTNTATLTSTTGDSNQANNTANAVSHTPTLEPTGDADNDGLPNQWEQLYGLDPFDNGGNGGQGGANGDADGDGKTNLQELNEGTHPRGFVITYLAEGATGAFFQTRLAIANPGEKDALVLVRFQTADAVVVPHYLVVKAHSRATIDVQNIAGMESQAFSSLIEADEQVVVDRTMTWDHSGFGSHAERGTLTRTATTWYLAEGATHGGFELFYLIQNAGKTPANVEITFLRPVPKTPVVKTYTIAGDSRFTLWVDEIPELHEEEMSAIIRSTNGVPIVVERAMYLNTPQQQFAAGTGSAGVTAPSTQWFLAEGATGPFFDMFMLIGNPTEQAATVEAKYQLLDGSIVTKTYDVAPLSRVTINVELEDARLANAAMSTSLTSTNGVPVLVERTMWFPGPTAAQWLEAHNSFGETTTGTRWAMGEGEQGGAVGKETFILIANTSAAAGTARVKLLYEDGSVQEKLFGLVANSRVTVQVGVEFSESAGKRFGAVVESIGANPAQIVVERAMYSSPGGVVFSSGTNAVATKLQD